MATEWKLVDAICNHWHRTHRGSRASWERRTTAGPVWRVRRRGKGQYQIFRRVAWEGWVTVCEHPTPDKARAYVDAIIALEGL